MSLWIGNKFNYYCSQKTSSLKTPILINHCDKLDCRLKVRNMLNIHFFYSYLKKQFTIALCLFYNLQKKNYKQTKINLLNFLCFKHK